MRASSHRVAQGMVDRRLVAILSADVVGYSRLMGSDESGTLARLKSVLEEVLEPGVYQHGGRIFSTAGDGFLAEFPSTVGAVECAVAIQTALSEGDPDQGLVFRMGINLGDVILEGGDVFGEGVNIAARLEQLAKPGGISISGTAYNTIRGELGDWFEGGSDQTLKNIDHPVAVWSWRGRDPSLARAVSREQKRKPAVAVVPVENLSTDRELDFLADVITDDIITLLAKTPGFVVISKYSTLAYRGAPNLDLSKIANDLDVRYVVQGSLRPFGDQIRVAVQLADAESGVHLWSQRFERPLEMIGEVEDEVVASIVANLGPELSRAEVEQVQRYKPSDMDAWSIYRRAGTELFRRGWNEESFRRAADLYRDAVAKDPEFALARGALALTLAIGHILGYLSDAEAVEAAEEAEHALALSGDDSEILGFAGCALSDLGEHDRGIDVLERAVELNPSNSQAWTGLGGAYLAKGDIDQAVEKLSLGIRISPQDPRLAMWGCMLAMALGRQGQLEEAIAEAQAAKRRDRNLYNSRLVLAVLLAHAGRIEEASASLAEARRLRPELSLQDVQSLTGELGMSALKGIWSHASDQQIGQD